MMRWAVFRPMPFTVFNNLSLPELITPHSSEGDKADRIIRAVLPPMPDPNQKQEDVKVKERNLLLVFVSKGNNIMAGGQQMDIHQLKDKAKEFILNPMEDENLPEKEVKEFELPDGSKWNYPVSLGVISLQTDRGTSYETYIMVQNELTRAFNEVRNEVAMRKFGVKFEDLNEDQRNILTKAVPLKISEAEPRNVGGKK